MNTKYNNIINELVSIEKKYLKYFFKSDFDFRENITIRTFDLLIKRNKVFNKRINNLKIHFSILQK